MSKHVGEPPADFAGLQEEPAWYVKGGRFLLEVVIGVGAGSWFQKNRGETKTKVVAAGTVLASAVAGGVSGGQTRRVADTLKGVGLANLGAELVAETTTAQEQESTWSAPQAEAVDSAAAAEAAAAAAEAQAAPGPPAELPAPMSADVIDVGEEEREAVLVER